MTEPAPPATRRASRPRRSPPPAAARQEGLDLARAATPEVEGVAALSRSCGSWRRFVAASCVFRFRIATSRPGAPAAPAATCSSRRPIAAGWTRSSSCTRCRPSRAAGSSAAARPRSPRPGASGSSAASAACCPVWRGGVGIEQHVASARAVIDATAASSSRCPRARSAGRPAGSARSATGWAHHRAAHGPPIVPLAMAGTEELYRRPADGIAGAARRRRSRDLLGCRLGRRAAGRGLARGAGPRAAA